MAAVAALKPPAWKSAVSEAAAPLTATPTRRRWPRIAVTAVFVVHGLLFASWTAHIPDVKPTSG